MKYMKKTKSAFTLIEVVLILFIVTIGLAAAISLALRSMYFHNIEKDLLTARLLAHEGMEIMINIKGNNAILGNQYDAWDQDSSVGIGKKYFIVQPFMAEEMTDIDDSLLQRYYPGGFFLHDPEFENTKFRRIVTTKASTTASSTIEVLVNWHDRGNEYNYKLETVLYDLSFN
jgi:type II secretory pathway pseudopilin PulG